MRAFEHTFVLGPVDGDLIERMNGHGARGFRTISIIPMPTPPGESPSVCAIMERDLGEPANMSPMKR